jgi:LPXTG-motif cell wall-anchored protein
MRSKVVRAGAALFMATAAFVPAHVASASSDNGNQDVPGFQCPADQALFDQIKAWIVEFGPLLSDPSQADPSLQGQIELLASLALLSDDDLCLTLTGSGGDNGGGDGGSTSTSEPASTTTSEPESTSTTSEGSTTSTTEQGTTSTTEEGTTTTTEEATTTTTAQETTTTTRPTTTTTAAATTSTTAATTSTTAATSTTEAHVTTDPTVGGVVVTGAGTLPVTGDDPGPLVALGFLTAGLGIGLVFVRKRFAS